jgi:hypothetical protein
VAFLAYHLNFKKGSSLNIGADAKSASHSVVVLGGLAMLVSVLIILLGYRVIAHDPRWHSMVDKLMVGASIENPRNVICNGISPELESAIRNRFSAQTPSYADDLINGIRYQDGARMMHMRVGASLVVEHPWGLDGSRQAYEKRLEQKCGASPMLPLANTHQSWLDLALALGLPGLILFAGLLLFFAQFGWREVTSVNLLPWAAALFLVSVFWFVRGFSDSLYREHYLQMQALVLGYVYAMYTLKYSIRR